MNVIPFKIVPLGNYTDGAALEVLNRYGLQHVRYTVNHFFYKDVLERLRKKSHLRETRHCTQMDAPS